jgi:hypothetical protein
VGGAAGARHRVAAGAPRRRTASTSSGQVSPPRAGSAPLPSAEDAHASDRAWGSSNRERRQAIVHGVDTAAYADAVKKQVSSGAAGVANSGEDAHASDRAWRSSNRERRRCARQGFLFCAVVIFSSCVAVEVLGVLVTFATCIGLGVFCPATIFTGRREYH